MRAVVKIQQSLHFARAPGRAARVDAVRIVGGLEMREQDHEPRPRLAGREQAPLSERKKVKHAGEERKRRIAKIFLKLRHLMQSNKDIYGDGSSALAQVSKAFSNWFEARKPGSGKSSDEIVKAAEALTTKLVLFLKSFTG